LFYRKQDEASESKSVTNTIQNPIKPSNDGLEKQNSSPSLPPDDDKTPQDIRVSKPLKKERRSAFSLNMDLNPKSKVEEQTENASYLKNLPKDAFDEKQLKKFWSEFLNQLKIEKRIPTYNALETTEPKKINDQLIQFELGSSSSEVEFEESRDRIVNGLKTYINNHSIKVETFISESAARINHIKSTKEIATEMAERNPNLWKLLNDFGLSLYD